MTTEQLRYFLEVARRRSFTEAAHTFYLTQPAITHQISALERELGTKLFLRTTRSVALTRAGELFLEDAKRILDQEDRALERLRQMGGSGQLELKIGYLNSPCRHFLPGLIRDYQERYPQVSLELIRRDATGIQTGAENGFGRHGAPPFLKCRFCPLRDRLGLPRGFELEGISVH